MAGRQGSSSRGRKYLPSIESAFVLRLVCSGLEAGLVPADAVERATSAFDQLRRHLRTTTHTQADQAWLEHMLCAALRSKGAETGYVLAVRVVEALRLLHEWRESNRRLSRKRRVLPMPKSLPGLYDRETLRRNGERYPNYPLGDDDPMNERGLE